MKEIVITKNILTENSDLLKQYFKDISKYPIYDGKKQIELARKAQQGDNVAKDKLINSNLRFVVTCAKQYVGQGVPLVDLISAGNLGLVQALENFDPDRGYYFISFAVWYIRREILKAIYNTGRTIRYPITYITKVTKVKKALEKYAGMDEPSEEELLNSTNLSEKQYNSVLLNRSYCQSIDSPISDDSKSSLKDIIPNEDSPFADSFTRDTLIDIISNLNPRESKVISEYFGIGTDQKTVKEIALELNIGEERVRQLKKDGIKRLRQRYGNVLKTLL